MFWNSFYSRLVRLKLCSWYGVYAGDLQGFYSRLVRLKPKNICNLFYNILFLFQIGAIKTLRNPHFCGHPRGSFYSRLVRLKPRKTGSPHPVQKRFLFQIGAIKTLRRMGTECPIPECFYSRLVRLKLDLC